MILKGDEREENALGVVYETLYHKLRLCGENMHLGSV